MCLFSFFKIFSDQFILFSNCLWVRKMSLSKSTLYNNFISDSVKCKAQQLSVLFSHLFFLIDIQTLSNLLSDMLYRTLFIMIFPVFKICIWMSSQMYIFQVCVASLSSSMYMNPFANELWAFFLPMLPFATSHYLPQNKFWKMLMWCLWGVLDYIYAFLKFLKINVYRDVADDGSHSFFPAHRSWEKYKPMWKITGLLYSLYT